MKTRNQLFLLSLLSFSAMAEERNIIFIMLDDLDILDLQYYNDDSTIYMPALDDFFDPQEAMVFENYYTSGPNCSQTRGSLLSGQYPIQNNFLKTLRRDSKLGISIDFPMISQVLDNAGYYTATIGKWHVGFDGDATYQPQNRGFDHSTVWYENDSSCTLECPTVFNNDNTPVDPSEQSLVRSYLLPDNYFAYLLTRSNQDPTVPDGVSCNKVYELNNTICSAANPDNYLPNALTNETIALLDTINDSVLGTPAEEPFFINLWYFTPHIPTNIPPDYDDVFNCGQAGEVTEACNYETGVVVINDEFDDYAENCAANEDRAPDCDGRVGQYAAQLSYLDRKISEVVAKVEDMYANKKLTKETLIIITSDNGGAPQTHANWGGDGGSASDAVSCGPSINQSSCPIKYRGRKNQLYERGIRVPLAIKRFGSSNNTTLGVNNGFLTSRDFYPTTVALADTTLLAGSGAYGVDFSDAVLSQSALDFFAETRPEFWQRKAGSSYRVDYPSNLENFICDGAQSAQPAFESNYTGAKSHQQNHSFAVRQDEWKLIYEPHRSAGELPGNTSGCDFEFDDEIYSLYKITNTQGTIDEYFGSEQNAARPDMVRTLQNLYYKWRNWIAFIDYSLTTTPNLVDGLIDVVSHCPNAGNCETVAVEHSTRLQVDVEQFSFAASVKIDGNGATCGNGTNGSADGNGLVAFKPGNNDQLPHSWKLKVINGKVRLTVWLSNKVQDDYSTVQLESSSPLSCDKVHHLAFTVQGSKQGGQLLRLYVDGVVEDKFTVIHTDDVGICTDNDPATYCPPHWGVLNVQTNGKDPLNRLRLASSDEDILLGNNSDKTNLFEGYISPPLLSTTALTTEEVRMLSMSYDMNERFTDHEIQYTPCTGACVTGGVPTPTFENHLNAWFYPSTAIDAVLELNGPNTGADLSSDLLTFTTKFRLNESALTGPYNTNTLAAQTENGSHAWILKLAPLSTEQATIKFNAWFGSCKLTLHSQANNATTDDFAIIEEGELHDIGISIDKTSKTAKLFLDGYELVAKTADGSCGDMPDYNNVYLGNLYTGCSSNASYNCEPFDGHIYAPRISNQLLTEDGFKWEARTQLLLY